MGQQPLQFLTSTRAVYYEKLRNELEKLRISVSKKRKKNIPLNIRVAKIASIQIYITYL